MVPGECGGGGTRPGGNGRECGEVMWAGERRVEGGFDGEGSSGGVGGVTLGRGPVCVRRCAGVGEGRAGG